MPTCVGGCGHIISSDVPVSRTCSTQNVRSATMGEQSKAVTELKITRMILIYLLVLVDSLGGCLGVHHPPEVISKSLDAVGHLDLFNQFSGNEIVDGRSSPNSHGFYSKHMWINKRLDEKIHGEDQNSQNRESSLKMLLWNVARLQQRSLAENPKSLSETVDYDEENAEIQERYWLDKRRKNKFYPLTQYISLLQHLPRPASDITLARAPHQVITSQETLLSASKDRQAQPFSLSRTIEVRRNSNGDIHNNISVPGLPEKVDIRSVKQKGKAFDVSSVNKVNSGQILQDNTGRGKNYESPDKFALFVRDENNPVHYLVAQRNNLSGSEIMGHSVSEDRTFGAVHTKSLNSRLGHNDNTFEGENIVKASQQEHENELSSTDSTESLIAKTVKQMEEIMKKRIHQYDIFFDPAEYLPESVSGTGKEKRVDTNSILTDTNSQGPVITSEGSKSPLSDVKKFAVGIEDEDYYDDQQLRDAVDDVTAEVIKVITSRKVPKNAKFWQTVSAYLDSRDYLSRTRRSPDGKRKHKSHRYVHLSITYGHVMPCEYKDRFYCMNGGTCVFVGALDIRTCRCPIGYTGVRCELIDQEYILSLLTNTLIFS